MHHGEPPPAANARSIPPWITAVASPSTCFTQTRLCVPATAVTSAFETFPERDENDLPPSVEAVTAREAGTYIHWVNLNTLTS